MIEGSGKAVGAMCQIRQAGQLVGPSSVDKRSEKQGGSP